MFPYQVSQLLSTKIKQKEAKKERQAGREEGKEGEWFELVDG